MMGLFGKHFNIIVKLIQYIFLESVTYHQQWSISKAFWADVIDKTLLKINSLQRKIAKSCRESRKLYS